MDGGDWKAAVHGVAKSRTWLSDFTFTFHFHALEEEMATHSSVLAWRIPGMGEPWWAAVSGVTQSQTRLKRLSSSSIPLLAASPPYPRTQFEIIVAILGIFVTLLTLEIFTVKNNNNKHLFCLLQTRCCAKCFKYLISLFFLITLLLWIYRKENI